MKGPPPVDELLFEKPKPKEMAPRGGKAPEDAEVKPKDEPKTAEKKEPKVTGKDDKKRKNESKDDKNKKKKVKS